MAKVLLDLASCDKAGVGMTTHRELLDVVVERAGSGNEATRLLSLQTLEQLAEREPEIIIDRVRKGT